MIVRLVTLFGLALPTAGTASAQGMDPVWVGQGAVAQSSMSNARANTRRAAGIENGDTQAAADPNCHSSLTAAKRQSIHRGRVILQGKAKADAWLKAECGG